MKKNTAQAKIITITDYIKTFSGDTQKILTKIRKEVKSVAPKAEETIKYGMPTFVLNGKNLVHFAGWEKHIGFYPTPTPIKEFAKDLAKYKVSKGAIQFPLDQPIPYPLIKKLVKSKMKQYLEK